MNGITATAETYDSALEEILEKAGLPQEALAIQEVGDLGERIDDKREPDSESNSGGVTIRATMKPEYLADTARDHLAEMLGLMSMTFEVRTVIDQDLIKIKVSTPDSAILIGRNGQTLDALQHLLNRMSSRPGLAAPYISVDVEEYRERRLARLEQVARRAAREALETKEEVILEPMSPADRKMVHMTLRSNLAVKTFSRGIEGDRAIVIVATEDAR